MTACFAYNTHLFPMVRQRSEKATGVDEIENQHDNAVRGVSVAASAYKSNDMYVGARRRADRASLFCRI
jgi:SLT domain-containing protein